MKTCPYCSGSVQDGATECRHCGRNLGTAGPVFLEREPGPRELERLAEIRRLQRIASGLSTQGEVRLSRTKGVMALLIVFLILVYVYVWKTGRSAELDSGLAVSYRTFNAAFGPGSPLSIEEKTGEFERYHGLRVTWEGTVVYVNHGRSPDLYISIRHRSASPTSDVILRFRETNRNQIEHLPVGTRIRYSGQLKDFGANDGFITLTDGRIVRRLDSRTQGGD